MGGRFHSLWDLPHPCNFLQIHREIYLCGQQQTDGGDPQPAEGIVVVGEADAGIEQGGGGCPDLGPDILGGSAVGPVVRFMDAGDYTAHQEGAGRIPPKSSLKSDKETTLEREGRSADISPAGGRDGVSGTAGGGDLRLPPPENGCTFHCDQAHELFQPKTGCSLLFSGM